MLAAVDQIDLLPAAWFLAVNLSPATLMWSEFLDRLDELPLGRMWVEVNVRDEPTAWFERFSDLWPDGVARPQMALDDTGATSASLKAIHQLEPDVVKVAPELVRGIDHRPDQHALVSTIGVFAKEVGAVLLAEGVESKAEADTLGEPRRAPGPGLPVRRARSARPGPGAGAEAPVARAGAATVRPVPAVIMDGKALAETVRQRVADRLVEMGSPAVCLATVLVGDDAPSRRYVASKQKQAAAVGIASRHTDLPADATQAEVEAVVADLAADPAVHGILVQLPLPGGLAADPVIDLIPPAQGRRRPHRRQPRPPGAGHARAWCRARPGASWPCSSTTRCRSRGAGRSCVGRSTLVGLPVALLLAAKGTDATVTIAHSRSADLAGVCREADILVSAVGVGRLVTPDFVKPGAAVLDVGISRTEAGIVGDVDFDAVAEVAGWITPMPGGTGAMTPAMLLENTVDAYCAQQGKVA